MTTLFGRTAEIDALTDRLDRVGSGQAQTVFIEGEAGIGKSRLVDALLDRATTRGFQIRVGRADEIERSRPFGALVDALDCRRGSADPERARIARLLTSEVSAPADLMGDAGIQFRVLEAILGVVEALTLKAPVLLAVEDVHWADPSTLLALRAMERRLAPVPLIVVATFRPSPRFAELEHVVTASPPGRSLHVRLGSLDGVAVDALVAEQLGAEPGDSLRAQLRSAAGNPLFASELVGALEAEGLIDASSGRAEIRSVNLPPSLRLTILRRIGYLPKEALDLLRVGSVLGTSFTVTELARLLGRTTASLLDALRDCVRSGLLVEQAERLAFRHDLIREALYEDTSEAVRRSLHRDAAQALAHAGAPVERRAEHLLRAASPGDPEAVRLLSQAGRDVAARAPAVAAQLLTHATEICDPSDPARDAAFADLAIALLWSGRVGEAKGICQDLLSRHHDAAVEGRLRLLLVHILLSEGRSGEAVTEAESALAADVLTCDERVRMAAWGSHARMLVGNLSGAAEMADAASQEAERVGDVFANCVARACHSMVTGLRGDFALAFSRIDRAVEIADRSPGREGHRFQLHVIHGLALIDLDRLEEAQTSFARGRRISEDIGALWSLPFFYICRLLGHFLAGEWDDAIREFDAGLELGSESGMRHGQVFGSSIRSMIALHRDELADAEEACAAAEREFESTGPQFGVTRMMWARALLLEAAGDSEKALDTLAQAWDLCAGTGLAGELPYLGPDLVRLATASGDVERARAAVDAIDAVTEIDPEVSWVAGAALLCRGLSEGDPATLEGAVARYRQTPRARETAVALEEAALALCRAGSAQRAGPLLDDALAIYDRLGARRDRARVASSMRNLGIARGRRGARRRPMTGWEALTPTEREVVRLALEGLTNPGIGERLYISPRTVQTHLAHVFSKLGVSSRVELAKQAWKRD